jgi:NAD(P)-dependent dehydrogenase (short-subunit alcohol dehydrogenase family)
MIRYDFSGHVALVIGGTSGIGLATAKGFVEAGARVVVAGRALDKGREAVALLGENAFFVQADVAEERDVAHVVAETVARFGRLDFAVNCAGAGGDMSPIDRADQDIWDGAMDINARGVWLAMRHEVPAMLASGGGAIVNMSSIYGLAGKAAHHAYVASKHAVVGMTRSVAIELAERGVRVNAICAGITRTSSMEQAERAFPEIVRGLVAEHPMKRMATPEEIAGAALWLCSEGAGYVTGTPLVVDGGFLAA